MRVTQERMEGQKKQSLNQYLVPKTILIAKPKIKTKSKLKTRPQLMFKWPTMSYFECLKPLQQLQNITNGDIRAQRFIER